MTYINRLQEVLAAECNTLKVNGLTTWDATDLYTAASKFLTHLSSIAAMGDVLGITTYEATRGDMNDQLKWDIPDAYKDHCIVACLDEVYEEIVTW